MFVIPENLIINVQMLDINDGSNIEDSNFPAQNMLNEHPKKIAKAIKSSVKIITGKIEWLGGFGIFNTNAISITNLKIKNEDGNILFQLDEIPMIIVESYYDYYHNRAIKRNEYYQLFSGSYSNVIIEFVLNAPSDDVAEIGLLFGGSLFQIGRALWGISDDIEDLSILKETLNGATILIKRNVLINKTYKVIAKKDEYELFKQLYQDKKGFWMFVPIKEIPYKESYLRYGIIEKLPEISEESQKYIKYQFQVREVI